MLQLLRGRLRMTNECSSTFPRHLGELLDYLAFSGKKLSTRSWAAVSSARVQRPSTAAHLGGCRDGQLAFAVAVGIRRGARWRRAADFLKTHALGESFLLRQRYRLAQQVGIDVDIDDVIGAGGAACDLAQARHDRRPNKAHYWARYHEGLEGGHQHQPR